MRVPGVRATGPLAALSAVAWAYLAVGHGRFWSHPRLEPAQGPTVWPSVTVVVPARDEADVLPETLPALLGQEYQGSARVVLVDDRSDDGTGRIAEELAGAGAGRLPLRVVAGTEPPDGWTGKLWALRQGVAAAEDAELLLFTDADIRHAPGSLARLVAAALAGDRDLVSVMARLRTDTAWERLLVPAFVYFFAQLYPFRLVAKATSRTAAAAGGCVLVRRAVLERAGGVEAVRGALIDDVSLARAVGGAGGRLWLGLDPGVVSIRSYPRLRDVWAMVSRSAFTQLRYSKLLLAGTVAGMTVVYLVPPAATLIGLVGRRHRAAALGGLAWTAMAATYAPTLRAYDRPVAAAPTLPVAAALYMAMTLDSARRHWTGRGAAWKGRTYRRG